MVLRLKADFKDDGADHHRLFDFEAAVAKAHPNEGGSYDRGFKTVVCRHWVIDLCMKMDDCEYLHELNQARMPECKWGEKCQVPDCAFRHTKEEDRVQCAFYDAGFCRKGPVCRFRHLRRAPEELPEEVDWDTLLGSDVPKERIDPETGAVHKTGQNDNYKLKMCKHWQRTDSCPFGDRCHFAHGFEELRQRGEEEEADRDGRRGANSGKAEGPDTALLSIISAFQDASSEIAKSNPTSDLGKDISVLPGREALGAPSKPGPAYFVLRMATQASAVASIKLDQWSVLPCFVAPLNEAFNKHKEVYIIFATLDNDQFIGVAQMKSLVRQMSRVPYVQLPPEARGESFIFDLRWLRTTSLNFQETANLLTWQPELFTSIPVAMCFECSRLTMAAGHALMVMLYRSAEEVVEKSELPDLPLTVTMEGPDVGLCGEMDAHMDAMVAYIKSNPSFLKDLETRNSRHEQVFRAQFLPPDLGTSSAMHAQASQAGPDGVPVGPGSIRVPDKPGFIMGCPQKELCHEMLRSRILAAPSSERQKMMECIEAGTLVILFSLEEDKVYGIFEALHAPEENIDPYAFEGGPDGSRLPVQVKFEKALEVPAVHHKQIPNKVLNPEARERSCFLPIPAPQMQNIVNLFARNNNRRRENLQRQQEAARENGEDETEFPPGASVHQMPPYRPGQINRRVVVNVDFPQKFKAPNRVIGKGGANIKRIREGSSVRISVKALHEHLQPPPIGGRSQDIVGPLQILFYSPSEEDMDRAEPMVVELAHDIMKKYEEYVEVGERMRQEREDGNGRQYNSRNSFEGDRGDDRRGDYGDGGRARGNRENPSNRNQGGGGGDGEGGSAWDGVEGGRQQWRGRGRDRDSDSFANSRGGGQRGYRDDESSQADSRGGGGGRGRGNYHRRGGGGHNRGRRFDDRDNDRRGQRRGRSRSPGRDRSRY